MNNISVATVLTTCTSTQSRIVIRFVNASPTRMRDWIARAGEGAGMVRRDPIVRSRKQVLKSAEPTHNAQVCYHKIRNYIQRHETEEALRVL